MILKQYRIYIEASHEYRDYHSLCYADSERSAATVFLQDLKNFGYWTEEMVLPFISVKEYRGLNCVMRPLEMSDVEGVMTWINDPDVVKNLQNFNKVFTIEGEAQYILKMLSSKDDFVFSFFERGTGKYIGQGGIHQISWQNKLGRLSLIIKREYWNKKYAQEAIPLLIEYAFKELGLHKLWLMVYQTNQKGLYLYQKLGFQEEGRLIDEYFWQGHYHTMVRMAMINQG